MVDREKFYTALSQGKMDEVKKLTQEALDVGESAETILKGRLIQAMDRVGVKFKMGRSIFQKCSLPPKRCMQEWPSSNLSFHNPRESYRGK